MIIELIVANEPALENLNYKKIIIKNFQLLINENSGKIEGVIRKNENETFSVFTENIDIVEEAAKQKIIEIKVR
ncbi:MAG: hypothetical protein B6U78_01890 [Candidatus Aenigmarchaeota archaeon ex4484_224]|nr:MAG: hypothetical protein B6U78_01890 [Candidatus Aenigmarchaeota archaeon ex4484_224]